MPPDRATDEQPPDEHVVTMLSAARALVSSLDSLESLRTENRQLKEALEWRAVIERAKGMLMARYGCDETEAFHMLVARSQRERRKVRAVASEVVAELPSAPTSPVVTRLHANPG
ncbi:ANTAR domain-containing response regulator [Streptomyces sp. NPDC059373]